jgi:ubiquinone/menaquinone biosynthesis C-methylase UbiE
MSNKKSGTTLSKWKDIWNRFAGNGIYPHELAFILDNPLRKFILSPSELVKNLHLTSVSSVLEIGSGPGYFSTEVSKNIPDGKVVLYDIQIEMLRKSYKKLKKNNTENAFFVRGDGSKLPFAKDSFDVVFMVTVLGEVSDSRGCVKSVYSVLRNGGILSITEMKGDPDLLSIDKIKEMAIENNFKFSELISTNKGFTINFIK